MNLSYDQTIDIQFHISFGTVGILYDKEKYPNETFDSWDDLYHSQFKNDILLVDGALEIMEWD